MIQMVGPLRKEPGQNDDHHHFYQLGRLQVKKAEAKPAISTARLPAQKEHRG